MDRAAELMHRYLDEIATPADIAELGRLLPLRPDLADRLAGISRMECVLETYLGECRARTAITATLAIRAPSPVPAVIPTATVRRGIVRWQWCAAAALLLATGILSGFWASDLANRANAVVSGRILVDGVEMVQVPDNSLLEVAGEDSAVIRLPDGSQAELAPDSAAVLRQKGWGRRKVVELDRGRATFSAGKGGKQLRVDTPLGSISARDAAFCVELQPSEEYEPSEEGDEPLNKRTTVLLVVAALFGQVEVESGGQHYVLAAGQKKAFADKSGGNVKKPSFGGRVVEVSSGSLTIEAGPPKKGGAPVRKQFKLADKTEIVYVNIPADEQKPTVGHLASIWLAEDSIDTAARVQLFVKQIIHDGVVGSVAADGKSFTLQVPAKGGKTTEVEVTIAEGAKLVYRDADKGDRPTAGYFARVWLKPGKQRVASGAVFSSKKITDDAGGKKVKQPLPDSKKPGTEGKKPGLAGTVKALAADGKSFTLAMLNKKTGESTTLDIRIGDETKIATGKEEAKLAVGQAVVVWLEKNSRNVARMVQVVPAAKPGKKPVKPNEPEKKKPANEVQKPAPDKKKPAADDKPPKPPAQKPAKPVRDPAPMAAVIDAEVDRHLSAIKVPAAPLADDAAFLRRVSLDLTGRIPTHDRAVAFLDSKDPQKRRKLIDELLDSPAYGQHFATIWRNLIVPRNDGTTKGQPRDVFSGWLAEQFNDDRGWDAIVRDMLLAEGPIKDMPQSTFLMANAENFRPQANVVAGSVARLFWGINLRCAECHNHPFADWKQSDFWGTAAFFGKLQFTGFKGGGSPILTESAAVAVSLKSKKGQPGGPVARGSGIVIPVEAGKSAGRLVKARFLRGEEPALDEKEPFRPRFAAWTTGADNPWFARAAVNRMWAHFFGRGLVHPLDALDTAAPSHPELMNRLTQEFVSSGFDLKHLARDIVSSKAYQRSSDPVAGNESDTTAFSHMAVKVLSPEVVYDSLTVLFAVDKTFFTKKQGAKGKASAIPEQSREQFARFFRLGEAADPTEYTQGIPQLFDHAS
jgi:hypothetical protein